MADAKQGKAPIEDFYNGSSQSRVVLAKPRLGSFGGSSFAASSSKNCNPFGSVLRPSTLKPSSNPFLKVTEEDDKDKGQKDTKEQTEDRLSENENKEDSEAPKFVPLESGNATTRTSNPVPTPAQPTASSSSGFVFGQNLSERVVIQESLNNGEAGSIDHSSTNGTTELLFTSAAASVKENQDEASTSEGHSGAGLAAAAAEYERSHARPPPPAANFNITGEEDEINVLQISCRLFAWEGGSWRERGRGVLRLNEAARGGAGARLVVRVAGSLRVVLNTKLWPDMVVERAGTKSLRITAADTQQQIKLYLIMGAPADIVQLYRALSSRVALSKRSHSAATERVDTHYSHGPADTPADTLCTADTSAYTDDKPAYTEDKSAYTEITYAYTENKSAYTEDKSAYTEDKSAYTKDTSEDTPVSTDKMLTKTEDEEPKPLKRKEPAEDETSPKRQCPVTE